MDPRVLAVWPMGDRSSPARLASPKGLWHPRSFLCPDRGGWAKLNDALGSLAARGCRTRGRATKSRPHCAASSRAQDSISGRTDPDPSPEGAPKIRLDRLLSGVKLLQARGDFTTVDVSRLSFDASDAGPDALHCCIPGASVDGHDLASNAVAAGAPALLCERMLRLPVPIAVVEPSTVRRVMATLAAELAGHPSRSLTVVGVTGTNGKTTVTHLLASIFEAHGWPTAVVGTLSGPRTTPEAPVLQRLLANHRDNGGAAAAIEVSSHALVAHRVAGMHFAAGVFTNLSQDHLDFHKTMEDYFAAKAELFRPERTGVGIVNGDDPWGRRLLDEIAPRRALEVREFSFSQATEVDLGPGGASFSWRGRRISLRSGGRMTVLNALAAATTAEALGVDSHTVAEGLRAAPVVPGRLEAIPLDQPYRVLIDYAHTPAALTEALSAARQQIRGGRVLVVFGCGGERDKAKRPLMGKVAADLADAVYLTSDNPRREDPMRIMEEVAAGARHARILVAEPDRFIAIENAIADALPGDVVLIAGKGHERYQETALGQVPFDDREVVRLIAGGRGPKQDLT